MAGLIITVFLILGAFVLGVVTSNQVKKLLGIGLAKADQEIEKINK